jgi:hypothetical protein
MNTLNAATSKDFVHRAGDALTNQRRSSAHALTFMLAVLASSCGFGHSIDRSDPQTLIENRGANRYEYRWTQIAAAPPRGPATPALGVLPAGARELGLIEVTSGYSGLGGGGLRASEAEFYPTLAKLAGEMGGTHFLVLRSTRETRMGDWLTSLTVDVVAAPQP